MSTNPNTGSDQSNVYGGGYAGYQPKTPKDDPYNSQWYDQQYTQDATGTAGAGQQYSTGQQQQQQSSSTDQQQQFYQPPSSAYRAQRASAGDASSASARRAALLSNALLWPGGLFFFFKERRNAFVRFHAAQSILFFGSLTVLYIVLQLIFGLPVVGGFLGFFLGGILWLVMALASLVWVFLMFQAYRGVTFKLPYFGERAEALIRRFSKK